MERTYTRLWQEMIFIYAQIAFFIFNNILLILYIAREN